MSINIFFKMNQARENIEKELRQPLNNERKKNIGSTIFKIGQECGYSYANQLIQEFNLCEKMEIRHHCPVIKKR